MLSINKVCSEVSKDFEVGDLVLLLTGCETLNKTSTCQSFCFLSSKRNHTESLKGLWRVNNSLGRLKAVIRWYYPFTLVIWQFYMIYNMHNIHMQNIIYIISSFPGGSDSKESACNSGDLGLSPWSGRSPGEGNGSPLQYSCLESSMDRGAWWATARGVPYNWTQLNT